MIATLKSLCKTICQRLTSKIRFLIVDFDEKTYQVTFLCYGGRAFFKKDLAKVIVDDNLISGLPPDQACFLGIKMGQLLRDNQSKLSRERCEKIDRLDKRSSIQANTITFDRKGNLIYFDRNYNLKVENAYAVASSKKFILQFNSILACRIGLHIGNKLMNRTRLLNNVLLFRKKGN